jgi:hypothetical protein
MTTPDEAMLTEWECDIRDALADTDGKRWICANDALNALIEHVRAGHSANAERVAALEAENARLRALLKPFARVADMEHKAEGGASVMVNVNRCRDARAALGGEAS